ncbi:MAG: chorismate mutase, partial [Ruminococcus sp.]|nr:chorismate mutase [Ruminococcus sp.]
IHELRKQIDELDNQLMELLAKRMRVCREIGQYIPYSEAVFCRNLTSWSRSTSLINRYEIQT